MTFFVSHPKSTLNLFQKWEQQIDMGYDTKNVIYIIISIYSIPCFISQQFEEFQSKSFIIDKQF